MSPKRLARSFRNWKGNVRKRILNLEDLHQFAKEFMQTHSAGVVVGLSGTLGAGKTTFVRECVKLLSPTERVMSPTYVLHQVYQTTPIVHHLDLYRLENVGQEELTELQYFDVLEEVRRKKGFLYVEWPEKCKDLSLLQLGIHLKFEIKGEERVIYAL
jgi:tRNA threonylcarbamoyladenosine biosynthesis protein TsaE